MDLWIHVSIDSPISSPITINVLDKCITVEYVLFFVYFLFIHPSSIPTTCGCSWEGLAAGFFFVFISAFIVPVKHFYVAPIMCKQQYI